MTPTLTSLIRLAPGEVLDLPLDTHTTLQVGAGTLVLREPLRWLADTVVAPAAQLSEGQCHRVAHAGWMVLQAGEGGAQLLSHRTLTAWQVLWRRLGLLTTQATGRWREA
ncbi:MAG: hypothetical protein EOO24_34050 [Comamonadaceae bacterium]|nr:MAG: hypothetical protein EOO24_34050 [Comamonadaceae bacterium]